MLLQLWQFVCQHYLAIGAISGYVFIAAVGAMAPPGIAGGGWYGWFYRFGQNLSPAAQRLELRGGIPPQIVHPADVLKQG